MVTTEEDRLTRLIAQTLKSHKEECLGIPGVVGIGMGWRGEKMSFVVQAERMSDVRKVRNQLADAVDHFPVVVELVTERVAAAAPASLLAGVGPGRSVPVSSVD
ncbi:MAG: hypothetical protein H7210_04015 [Pyrinomonadaceae bacterium]|nr:hypothetical protein [Phycisphaerales bacterium]